MDYALQGITTLEEVSKVAATSEGDVSLEEEVPELVDEVSDDAHPDDGEG